MKALKKFLPLGALISAALAILLFLVCDTVVPVEGAGEAIGNGIETTFGKKEEFMGISVTVLKFNFMGLVTVLLAVLALIFSAVSMKKSSSSKGIAIVAAVIFVVAAIFFFCAKSFVLSANDVKDMAEFYKNGIGPIIAGIFSIVGACAVAVPAFLKD